MQLKRKGDTHVKGRRKEERLTQPREELITAVSYSAALMGALIEFTKRQALDDRKTAREWALMVRQWLHSRKPEYSTH